MASTDAPATPPRAALYDLSAIRALRQTAFEERAAGLPGVPYRTLRHNLLSSKASPTGQRITPAARHKFKHGRQHADIPSTTQPGSRPDPLLFAMLDGLKEIERLRAALSRLLFAVESGRYGPAALRALVRQECADALDLLDGDDRAPERPSLPPPPRLLEAPKSPSVTLADAFAMRRRLLPPRR